MPRIDKTVFVSYRRTNIGYALAIYQNLSSQGYDVFFDYNSIDAGDFGQIILNNIASRAHFVVLLTPSALERLDEKGDWLRREIEYAIETKRNIVPLTMEDFDWKIAQDKLTGKLAPLGNYNALRVPADYFMEAMDRLCSRYLNIDIDAVLHPRSAQAQQAAAISKRQANAQPEVQEKELTAGEWFEKGYQSTNYDEEIQYYTEAIRLKPDYASAYYNRGIARENKGDLDGALDDYNNAIHLKPDYVNAYVNRGIARQAQGDLDGALDDYNNAIRIKPDDIDAYINRGNARQDKGNLDGALDDYNQAIRINPSDAIAYNNRGNARQAQGDLDGALDDYNQAIRIKPDYALAYVNRGVARKNKGDLDGALDDYNQAIRLKPDYADAFYNRGNSKKKKGDTRGAINDYQKYLDLGGGIRDGDQEQVEQIIRDLKKKL